MEISALNKKKKLIMLIAFIVFGVLAFGGIVTAFLLNYNSLSPDAPTILDDGNGFYITTSANENYKGYRFKFSANGKNILVDCDDNILSVEKMKEKNVEVGKTYKVSVCYLGETEGSSSQFSKSINWTCSDYLDAPVIERSAIENKITWQAVENADLYIVYYNDGHEIKSATTSATFFDYSILSGGDKEIFVVATSSNEGYIHSKQSNPLSFHHVYKLRKITSASFNSQTKTLHFDSVDDLKFIKLSLDEGLTYRIVKLGQKELSGYSVDLSTIEESFTKITLSPYPADENSVYTDAETVVQVINN